MHAMVRDYAKNGIIGELLCILLEHGYEIMITADHGNAELMQSSDGQAWTAHTTNPVPCILVEGEQRKLPGHGNDISLREDGGLADIAPTLLQILNLPQPEAMTGRSLIDPVSNLDTAPMTARLPQPV